MKFSAVLIVALSATTSCQAFTTPARATPFRSSSSLEFAPKGRYVPTTSTSTSDITQFPVSFSELSASTLSPDLSKRDLDSLWERFSKWVTNTENRLYIGWFGTLMFPTLLTAATCFVAAMVAAPPGT